MRRHLPVLLFVVFASGVGWIGWGIYGWAAVTLTYGLSLLFRAVTLYRGGGAASTSASKEGMSLVAVSAPVDPWEAELICQALETDGIAATYFGRTNGSGVVPGGGIPYAVGLGRVRIAVHERAATQAAELLARMQIGP
jgi:hypothetical protein